jgi:hypothetical protein
MNRELSISLFLKKWETKTPIYINSDNFTTPKIAAYKFAARIVEQNILKTKITPSFEKNILESLNFKDLKETRKRKIKQRSLK